MTRRRVLSRLALLMALAVGAGSRIAALRLDSMANGSDVRAIAISANPGSIALDSRTERLFITSPTDNAVSVFNAVTGQRLRTVGVGYSPSAMAVDERAGHIFVADHSDGEHMFAGSVSVLDGLSGNVVSRFILPGETVPQRIVVDGQRRRIFVGDQSGDVSVLDENSGRVLRTMSLTRRDTFDVTLAVTEPGGHVFVTNDNVGDTSPPPTSLVGVLDASSGRLQRTVTVGTFPRAVAIDARSGHVFVASQPTWLRGSITMLDARSGRSLRSLTLSTMASALAMAVDEHTARAFVLQDDGIVRVLDTRRDTVTRSVAIDSSTMELVGPVAMDLDQGAARVYVASEQYQCQQGTVVCQAQQRVTRLSVIDANSGALLRTISVGPPVLFLPNADSTDGQETSTLMAVDKRSHHIFVIVDGGHVRMPGAWNWVPGWLRHWLPFMPGPTFTTRTMPTSLIVLREVK